MGLEGLIIGSLACCRDEHISGGLGGGDEFPRVQISATMVSTKMCWRRRLLSPLALPAELLVYVIDF